MPRTRLTSEKLKNHWHYHRFFYLLIVALSVFGLNLLFSVTEYRPPRERRLDVHMVSAYSNSEGMQVYAGEALATLPFVSPVEEINFYPLAYGDESDFAGVQKYTVMLGAQEGDIFMVNRQLFEQLVAMGAVLPLDEYINAGKLYTGDRDLLSVTYPEYQDEEEAPPTGNMFVYGLQMAPMNKMLEEGISFDNRDKFMVLMSYSQNQENAVLLMDYLAKALEAPLPEGIAEVPAATQTPALGM